MSRFNEYFYFGSSVIFDRLKIICRQIWGVHKIWLLFLILIRVVNGLQAELKLAPVFSDNMVLQRDVAIPLRGMAKNLKVVTVNFDGIENETRVTNTFRTDQFDPNAEH